MSETIYTSNGKEVLVDDDDYEWLSQWKWYYHGRYVIRTKYENGECCRYSIHREIMKLPRKVENGVIVDHIDRNTLNNQKSNLRVVTPSLNSRNRATKSKSGFMGVYPVNGKTRKPWRAQVALNGKTIHLGCYSTPEEAHEVYLRVVADLYTEP